MENFKASFTQFHSHDDEGFYISFFGHLWSTVRGKLKSKTRGKQFQLDIDYRSVENIFFELTLEMSGKSVKRALKEYMASPKLVQELTFKDIFRFAAQYGLIEDPSPWFEYQDSRNNTVHDYGENFADTVLKLIQRFYIDAVQLHLTLVQKHGV